MAEAALFLLFFCSLPGIAHEDTDFPVALDGTLLDYPEDYGPAAIEVVAPESHGDATVPRVTIKTGGHQLRLPDCLGSLFVLPEGLEIRAHGSWYHRFDRLPPYLVVDLPTNAGRPWFDGHSLLFNMRNAELIEASSLSVKSLSGVRSTQLRREVVDEYCDEAERQSLKRTPNSAGSVLLCVGGLLGALALALISGKAPPRLSRVPRPFALLAHDAQPKLLRRVGWCALASATVIGLFGVDVRELLVAASDIHVVALIFYPSWILLVAMVPALALADEFYSPGAAVRIRGLRSGDLTLVFSLGITLLGLGIYGSLSELDGMENPSALEIALYVTVLAAVTWLGLRVRPVPMKAYWLVVCAAAAPHVILLTPIHPESFLEWLPERSSRVYFLTYPLLAGGVVHVSASWVSSSFRERHFVRLALAALLWVAAASWLSWSSVFLRRWWWPF